MGADKEIGMSLSRRAFIQSFAISAAGFAFGMQTTNARLIPISNSPRRVIHLRGLGALIVNSRVDFRAHSSWITLTAETPELARMCGSKFLADLLEFGDARLLSDEDRSATTVTLEDRAWWVIGGKGRDCHILCARSKKEINALARKAKASLWAPIPQNIYPPWLDCMDNAALGFWFLGGGALPTDVNADFAQFHRYDLTACMASGVDETRLIAPGLLDTTVLDWWRSIARQNHTPYRMLLNWTQPMQPPMLWNRIPLPYVTPEDGAVPYADFQHESLQVFDAFVPVPAGDPYTLDLRRRVAKKAAEDPFFMGHHGSAELGGQTLVELSRYSGMPSCAEAWHAYLQKDLGLSLERVGLRYEGNRNAYADWSDVPVPSMREFIGWGERSVDLAGEWQGLPDPMDAGGKEQWYADGAPRDWKTLRCNDVMILEYAGDTGESTPRYWIRKQFVLTERQLSELKYLHVSRAGWHSLAPPTAIAVYLNGKLLKDLTVDHPLWPDQDQCLELGDAAHLGRNLLTMKVRGPLSYVFLSPKGRWYYPSEDRRKNLLWYDAIDFTCVYKLKTVENNLKAIRAGDPTRPIKIMAPWNLMDRLPKLCMRYGAYPHDTGQGAGCWGPWMPRYVSWMGIPTSSEPGGPAGTPQELRQFLTFFLMLGNSMADVVFDFSEYAGKPDMAQWMLDNREMMRCLGKMAMPTPEIAVLRSVRAVRLNFQGPWSWDIARGEVQATGRTADYVDLPDFADGAANRFKVVFDDATETLAEEDVDAIVKYVRNGGIFVAIHLTGMHTPDTPYSWPISRLTGLVVKNRKPPFGEITFAKDQALWPSLREKTLQGDGLALDWMKKNRTGSPLAQRAGDEGVTVVATWDRLSEEEGNIAVATRKLGKGMVVTLGSTFWRGAMDRDGHWMSRASLSNLLDELFQSLGVPRQSWVIGTENANQEIWAERWVSKNGVYDLYPVARINTDATQPPLSASIRIRSDHLVRRVRDLAVAKHPIIDTITDSTSFTLPQIPLEPMECHVYASPREDMEMAVLRWLEFQKNQWGSLSYVSERDIPPVPLSAKDTIPLAEGWRMSVEIPGEDWTAQNYEDRAWRVVKPETFASLGLPENSVARFRRTVRIPRQWKKRNVTLFFDAPYWFWGFKQNVRMWINGKEISAELIPTNNNGAFSIDVTPYARRGVITLALEVDGHLPAEQKPWRPRPAGITGTFYLQALPISVRSAPLNDWMIATDVGVMMPATAKSPEKYLYFETRFTLPKERGAKRLFLKSDRSLNWIILNNHVLAVPALYHSLDITRLALRDGENILRWIPDVNANENPAGLHEFSGTIPPLTLVWTT